MFGTDAGVDYLLYTNGVYSKTVSGTGSSVSFGLQTTVGDYTAVASNTTTTVTYPVPSTVTVFVPSAPSFSVQPVGFVSATNGIARYSVTAVGAGGGYQCYKGGVALTDDGHYSGTTTAQMTINPVLATDAATSANGYYCRIANLCGVVLNSTTNALTIQVGNNLVWQGTPSNTWNIATTANWTHSAGTAVVFNQGDNVTLNDTAINLGLVLASPILAPGTVTFNHSATMGIGAGTGNGNLAGSASKLIVNGPPRNSHLVISNANSFAGGTTINDGWLTLNNINSAGPGTSTITLAGTGSSLLELNVGGATTASPSGTIPGLNVTANSIVQFNVGGTAAGSIYGPITGTAGTNLTLKRTVGVTTDRIRVWHTNFTCDLNLVFDLGTANLSTYNPSGAQIYNGVISGTGVIETRHGGRVILNRANTYNGGVLLDGGTTGAGNDSAFGPGSIRIVGGGGLYASGGDRTIANSVAYTGSGGTLTFTDTNILTMSGSFDLGSGGISSAENRTISVATGSRGVISGVISDSSFPGCGLTKSGSGTLYLNPANTYTGPTTNSAGVLAGTGSISGSVGVTGGGIGGGSPSAIGTLSVGGNVTFSGTGGASIRINRSGLQCDKVSVSGTLANSGTGTVTVTNLGAALQAGDNFGLFPGKTVTGGSALVVTGAGVTWTNKLAFDGSIEVLSTVASNSTNITASVSGGQMTLS